MMYAMVPEGCEYHVRVDITTTHCTMHTEVVTQWRKHSLLGRRSTAYHRHHHALRCPQHSCAHTDDELPASMPASIQTPYPNANTRGRGTAHDYP